MKVPTASRRHASRAGRQAHTGPTRGSVHLQQGVSTPAARARPRHERLKGKAGPTSAHPKKGSAAHLQRGPVPDAVARGRHRLATLPQQPHHRRLQVGVRSGRAEGAPCGVGERERAARQSSGIHQQSPFAYFQSPVPSPPPPLRRTLRSGSARASTRLRRQPTKAERRARDSSLNSRLVRLCPASSRSPCRCGASEGGRDERLSTHARAAA